MWKSRPSAPRSHLSHPQQSVETFLPQRKVDGGLMFTRTRVLSLSPKTDHTLPVCDGGLLHILVQMNQKISFSLLHLQHSHTHAHTQTQNSHGTFKGDPLLRPPSCSNWCPCFFSSFFCCVAEDHGHQGSDGRLKLSDNQPPPDHC